MSSSVSIVFDEDKHPGFPSDKFWWSILIDPNDEKRKGTIYKFGQYADRKLGWYYETEEVPRDTNIRQYRLCSIADKDLNDFKNIFKSMTDWLNKYPYVQMAVRRLVVEAIGQGILPVSAFTELYDNVPIDADDSRIQEESEK